MPVFAPETLAAWTSGKWTAAPVSPLTGFTTDTRQLREGQIFVALKTDKRDGHDFLPAAHAALGAEVDHPVGSLHDVEIVLHHEHRVARLDEPFEHRQQLPDVGHVEAGRRLVENIECLSGGTLRQFSRQFHPLGLTP